ncbi:hypothetical protein AAG747_23390 [Rapidithrix thailandica]|uniref:Lipoprotein n=1 Tax=Rapidithrix thailandica TaxID=413964 RepID=A0AAW9SD68_9BACT
MYHTTVKQLPLLVYLLFLGACGGKEFVKSPIDTLILEMDKEKNFTIILYDMDVEESFSDVYQHKYKLIKEKEDGTPYEEITEWYEVDEGLFNEHQDDMGMEIVSKVDGKVTKQTAPPGYSRYVGNDQYGKWATDSQGKSFWEFYGQYAFMSNMMGLMAGPVYRTYYVNYKYNYRGSRPYYGRTTSSGLPQYGSRSSVVAKQNPNNSFKNRVQSRVTRSSGPSSRTRSGSSSMTSTSQLKHSSPTRSSAGSSYNSGSSANSRSSSSVRTRSGSRYSSGSSTRSRSYSSGGK